jgi:hypothetical protein
MTLDDGLLASQRNGFWRMCSFAGVWAHVARASAYREPGLSLGASMMKLSTPTKHWVVLRRLLGLAVLAAFQACLPPIGNPYYLGTNSFSV